MNNKQMAIKNIEELSQLIHSTNRVLLTPKNLIAVGIGAILALLLVPLVDFVLSITSEQFHFNNLDMVLRGLGAWALFSIIQNFYPDVSSKDSGPTLGHLIRNQWFMIASVLILAVGFIYNNADILFVPTLFILYGFYMNTLGKYSSKAVTYASWALFIISASSFYLSSVGTTPLYQYQVILFGLIHIILGFYLKAGGDES